IHHLLQRAKRAVVEEYSTDRGVAQGRRPEHAAILRLVFDVGANGSTYPEIEILRLPGVCERRIAWSTQGFILEIGKDRRPAIARGFGRRPAAAIGFVRIVEQSIAAHFGFAEARLALKPMVILARVGVKARLLDLIAADGEHRLVNQELRVREDLLSEQAR